MNGSDGSLSATLAGVANTLNSNATRAASEAGQVLTAVPGQQQALLLLVGAHRVLGDAAAARAVLESMADKQPQLASVHYELGLLLGGEGHRGKAIKHLSRVVELEPNHPAAWRALGMQLALEGDAAGAGRAFARQVRLSVKELKLLEDATAGSEEDVAKAENMLRQCLAINPTDVLAMRMLAQRETWLGRYREAASLLHHALRIAPDYAEARQDYAFVLQQEMKWQDAIGQLDIILSGDPDNAACLSFKAWNLLMLGEFDAAFALFDAVRPGMENELSYWVNYGHALRTVGRREEAIGAYRKCLELDPGFGLIWWSLANLKTYRFSDSNIASMEAELQREDLPDEHRCHIEFALGKAREDARAFAASFEHYHRGNSVRRRRILHNPGELTSRVAKSKALFTREFFRARAGLGCASPDPILIVGMPRAGSTLIEQILASHSAIEGTMELPDIPAIVAELRNRKAGLGYPEIAAELDGAALRALGEHYLELTRYQRKLDRPHFTDKAPLNFQHIGLIHLILPNAKIIDARRHPLGCCFSGYKQCFQMGSMPHTYDLAEIARYYRNYVELMAHFDAVLPGRVHRVFHESMVDNPEVETRRLLDYCGVPFEPACLRFYESDRAVRTSSSEQVRRPISAEGVESWKSYETWLQPMIAELGDVLDVYPSVPAF